MEKTGRKVTEYYSSDCPEFFVHLVKSGKGRGCIYEAWIGKDGHGVMDYMFGIPAVSEAEMLEIIEANIMGYARSWECEHGGLEK